MLAQVLFLLPPSLTAAAVYCADANPHPRSLNAFVFALILASAWFGVLHPPSDNALANYVNGFLLLWYLIWSANILFMHDVRALRQLRSMTVQDSDFCYWEPLRRTTGLHRLAWALDLSTNFRGLGWMSTDPDATWPPAKYRWRPTTTHGLTQRLRRVAVDCIILGTAMHLADASTIPVLNTLAIAASLYSLMDGVHAAISIVAVHIFGARALGTWGRSELYPQLFGELSAAVAFDLKAFWGNWWHDLLKGGLQSVTGRIVSRVPASKAKKGFLQATMSFLVSGCVHAAATYSVSPKAAAAAQVAIAFSSQMLGIGAQQGVSHLFSRFENGKGQSVMGRVKTAVEIGLGLAGCSCHYIGFVTMKLCKVL